MENNEETSKQFLEKLNALKQEYHKDLIAELRFPKYNILPDEVILALAIIKKEGGVNNLVIVDVPTFPVIDKKQETPLDTPAA